MKRGVPGRASVAGVAAVAVAAVAVAACTLTTSLDGLEGPPLAGDAATSDDRRLEDVVAPADVGTDAPRDAAVPSFCGTVTPTPTFCDDFERTSPQGAWAEIGASASGTVVIGTRSDGGRELVTSQPAFVTGNASARLVQPFESASIITYAFRLRIEAPPAQGAIQIMPIFIDQGGGDRETVYVMARGDGASLVIQDFSDGNPGFFSETPVDDGRPFSAERAVSIRVSLTGGPRVRVTVDGAAVIDTGLPASFRPGKAYVEAGIHYGDAPAGPLVLHVDDVVVDVQ